MNLIRIDEENYFVRPMANTFLSVVCQKGKHCILTAKWKYERRYTGRYRLLEFTAVLLSDRLF